MSFPACSSSPSSNMGNSDNLDTRKKKRQDIFLVDSEMDTSQNLGETCLIGSTWLCRLFGHLLVLWLQHKTMKTLFFLVYLFSSKIDIVGHISMMVGTSSKFLQHSSPPLQFCLCPAWLPDFPCSGSLPGYPSPFLKENIK